MFEVIDLYGESGFDAIGITDHISDSRDLNRPKESQEIPYLIESHSRQNPPHLIGKHAEFSIVLSPSVKKVRKRISFNFNFIIIRLTI